MTANYECDLHGHTNRSDGNDSPVEFLKHAADRGVKISAITDHDVIPPETVEADGKEWELTEYAKSLGIQVLKGIEISCETFIDDTHLVCFGCDWKDPYFKELDQFTIKSKVNSYRMLVGALSEHGMPMTWEEVLDNNGNPLAEEGLVQKKMIFELMARKGYVEDWSKGKLFVKNNKEIVIKREKPDAVNVIHKIKSMGGIVIMAHPYLVSEPITYQGKEVRRKDFIDLLIDAGLDGIEASYTYDKTSYNGAKTAAQIKEEIEAEYRPKGLIISGGSDYHNDGKKGVKNPRDIGDCGITLDAFMADERLKLLLQ